MQGGLMVKTRKVILWGREDLLGRSVELFLSEHQEWEVLRLPNRQVDEGLLEITLREKPDVAILYLGNCSDNQSLPMRLIQQCPGLKVITVSLENNTMAVYCKQEVMVENVSDLLSVIEG
jgi:hypothetical protein